jgi:hypothetical protein
LIDFDIPAIYHDHELRAESRAPRQQPNALTARVQDRSSLTWGISTPMLMEVAYDLTALGLHEFARLYCEAAGKWEGEKIVDR